MKVKQASGSIRSEYRPSPKCSATWRLERGIHGIVAEPLEFSGIVANKRKPRHQARERTDIDDGNGHEDQKMGYETVNSGTNVDVGFRVTLKNPSRRPKILMKVVASGDAGFVSKVCQNRVKLIPPGPKHKIGIHLTELT
jgi:hypothetical protein